MEFSLKTHWRFIEWGKTLQVNLVRTAVTGTLFSILLILFGDLPLSEGLLMIIVSPFVILGIILTLILLSKMGIPFVNLLLIGPMLYLAIGDVFVYLVKSKFPRLVPADDFKPFNFAALYFVFNMPTNLNEN